MPLARAAAVVKRRLGVGRSPFGRVLGELDAPRDARVLVLGDDPDPERLRALRRRFGDVAIGEARGAPDLVVIDVAPERVPRAIEELLPSAEPAPGGTVVVRLVTDLVAAYQGPLAPEGAERTGEFLKRRFGRLRLDEPTVRSAFRDYESVRLVADSERPFLGWAVLRVRAASAPPEAAAPATRGRLPGFTDEVRALAADGQIIALDLVGPCDDARCVAQGAKWGGWARTAFHGTVPLAELPEPPVTAGDGTEIVVPGVAMALLPIPDSLETYLQAIGPKSRNMLRKFEREGYATGPLDYNAHLEDLHEVNVSKPVRSGGPMTEAYLQPLKPIGTTTESCPRHRSVYVGAFCEGRALGYSRLVLVNELAVIDQILGHADALPHGVMNGLVHELVEVALASGCVRAINYLTLRSSTPTLDRFKRSVGFEARAAYLRVPAT